MPRGLTEVGTVSVGVSGSRVEPSSSPLQLGLAAAFYTAGGSGYETFFDAELALFTVLLGASVFLVLRVGAPRKPIGAVGLAAAGVSLPLFSTYAFFGWHSSGMESPVANSLAAITVGLLALSMRNRRWLVVAGIAAGLFAISRVEFVVHAAPLLLVAAIYLRARGGTLREMASLLTPAVVIWLAVLAIRFAYFGSLTPNSALEPFTADPLSPGASLAAWAKPALPIAIAVAYFVIRVVKRGSSSASGWSGLHRSLQLH